MPNQFDPLHYEFVVMPDDFEPPIRSRNGGASKYKEVIDRILSDEQLPILPSGRSSYAMIKLDSDKSMYATWNAIRDLFKHRLHNADYDLERHFNATPDGEGILYVRKVRRGT